MVIHARQVIGQMLALGAALGRWLVGFGRACPCAGTDLRLQRCKLCLETCLVGGQRLGKQLALLGAHALGVRAELPPLEPGQLEVEFFYLRIAPLDRLLCRVDPLALLPNMLVLFCNMRQ